ncbi:multidrug ABC transporter ATPase [Streptomonospora alba]|uniref:Multidrug ABC transporter ATPase n=1 Tax=Streptomonospora alba TaxID=183763 RepID=A0A0C2JJV0_9ACTN|nr:ABC transporter ATP-binding protein [Streptomonospora alba]KIH99200.1 multidrug ABC transporter ATPase [Streptomonospora alba]
MALVEEDTHAPAAHGGADGPGAAVEVSGLRMRYGDSEVLAGVDLHVRSGEVVVLLGPNGAGKTTTVEILEGFRARSAGDVRVLGADPATADERWRARLGVVMQSWRDHGRWRVEELLSHLAGFYAPYAEPGRPKPRAVPELLETVGLSDYARRRINTLSGGQRRRLDVAIGIVGRPEVLFLDEPTAGFDPEARRGFHDLVHGLADENTAILLTTHDLDEAEKLADRILILAGGRVAAEGSAEQLAGRVSADAEVKWTRGGQRFVHSTPDATAFLRGLFADYGDEVADLEVRRAGLEDAYISLVNRYEAGGAHEAASAFAEEIR